MGETVENQWCNDCTKTTRHEVLYRTSIVDEDEIPGYGFTYDETSYTLYKCAGCQHFTLISDFSGSSTNGESVVTCFPPRMERQKPKWLGHHRHLMVRFLGDPVFALLDEVYKALANNALRLAVLGVRSLIEHLMIEKIGDHGSFPANLEEFFKQGHVSKRQRESLEKVIELGHAVTHRSHKPKAEQVEAALDVVETVMRATYNDIAEIEEHIKDLPPRKPPKKT